MSSVNIISSPSSSPPLLPVVSLRNILKQFPEFLVQLLPYIADRTVFNAIASSNKEIYQSSKLFTPPWPMDIKIHHPDGSRKLGHGSGYGSAPIFSPNGTQIACYIIGKFGDEKDKYKIAIFDQRRGLLRFCFRTHQGDEGNEIGSGWFPASSMDPFVSSVIHLTFSENYLISATGDDGLVQVWDYNDIAASEDFNYVTLVQEFSVLGGKVRQHINIIDILTCDSFVAVGYVTNDARNIDHVLLKDMHNVIEPLCLTLPSRPPNTNGCFGLITFTIIDRHLSIFIRSMDAGGNSSVRIWRPYDGNSLNTVLEVPNAASIVYSVFSRDYSMLVLVTRASTHTVPMVCQMEETVTLYSFDKDNYLDKLTLKQSVVRKRNFSWSALINEMIRFSPDDKFISYYDDENGLTFWDVTTGNNITNKIEINHNEYERKYCNVHSFSPVDRQRLLLVDEFKYYIASFTEKKSVKESQPNNKRLKSSQS